jgi:two-component system sensor histidine kinase/response regulator
MSVEEHLNIITAAKGSPEPSVLQICRMISAFAAPVAMALASLVLVGWLIGLRALTTLIPNYATVKPNTAFCFFLAGLSLWLLRSSSSLRGVQFNQRYCRLGQICALFVGILGLLTLGEYALNLNLGIDQTLLQDIWTDARVSPPGRMSIATAFAVFMLGSSLVFLGGKTSSDAAASQILALSGLAAAGFACLDYAYGDKGLHQVSVYTTMGVHASLVLTLLCAGTLFVRPDRGLISVLTSKYSGGQMARLLLPLALTLPFFIGWFLVKGAHADLYGTEFGLAAFAAANAVFFTILVWISSRPLNTRTAHFARARSDLEVRFTERSAELAHANEELQSLRAQAFILDLANDAILIRDQDDRITYWNQGAQRLYAYTKEEAVGHDSRSLFRTKFPQSLDSINAQLLATGHWEGELVHSRRDGALVIVASSWTLQRDDSNRTVSIVEMNYDITVRKKAENELQKNRERLDIILNRSLDGIIVYQAIRDELGVLRDLRFEMINPAAEKLIGRSSVGLIGHTFLEKLPSAAADGLFAKFSRIIEENVTLDFEHESLRFQPSRWFRLAGVKLGDGLALSYTEITARKIFEQQLQEAKERAESADNAKSDFLANMSHEIRTPMNGVIGLTEMLLDTRLDDEQRNLAGTIRTCGESLLGLINDILDFSKIEAGELTFEELDFDLRKVVEDTLEMMAGPAQAKGIELVGGVETDVPTKVRGDPGRVHQVLTNLIGNAIKFTKSGEVAVRVTATMETKTEVHLHFEIRDTGIGIPHETQARLFQPFVQADSKTSRKFGGTGLGLVISKRLAERMHGSVGFESAPGKGSTFWAKVRLNRQIEANLQSPDVHEFVDVRILIVDDNETSRRFLHNQIIAWRLHNGSASSGTEAMAKLHQSVADKVPYSVAIIDLQMPEMDGLALVRKINADSLISATRIILLTPFGKPIPADELHTLNITACCAKPVRQSLLFNSIVQALTRPPSAKAPTPDEPPSRATTSITPRREHILLAEDNLVNQQVALGHLGELGYDADVVNNGIEVLNALEKKQYDVILMDCQMPDLDGYEATREVRRREGKGDRTWIIAMTANAMIGDREKCLGAGMDDYLSKPLRRPELNAALKRRLQDR